VFLGQQLGLRALFFLPKTTGSGLVAVPNAVGSGCQARPKTFLKGTTSVGSRSTRLRTLQKKVKSGYPARPTVFGSTWVAGLNILGSDYTTIPKGIIICIINILKFIIKNIIIYVINIIGILNIIIIIIIILNIHLKNIIVCVRNVVGFLNISICVINIIIFIII
jgi:hypothetical protein